MLEITLLRAARLQSAIKDALKMLEVRPRVEVSIFSEMGTIIEAEHDKLSETIARRLRLVSALFDIRRATGRANVEGGVSDLLAEQAENDMLIEMLSVLAGAKPGEGIDVNIRRAERLEKREESTGIFGRNASAAEVIEIGLLSTEEIERFRVQLLDARKRRAELRDRLAELNAGTRLQLSDETVATLEAEHLL